MHLECLKIPGFLWLGVIVLGFDGIFILVVGLCTYSLYEGRLSLCWIWWKASSSFSS